MPSDDQQRGIAPSSRGTVPSSRGAANGARGVPERTIADPQSLDRALAEQVERRARTSFLPSEAAAESAAAARRLRQVRLSRDPGTADTDGFEYVARNNLAARENVATGPALTEADANDFLKALPLQWTPNETFVAAARAEAARTRGRNSAKIPPNATPGEIIAARWREEYSDRQSIDPHAVAEAAERFQDPGENSIPGALKAISTNTVGYARSRGMPLTEGRDAAVTLLQAHLVSGIIYVGPGYAAMFDASGKLRHTPYGYLWQVAAVPEVPAYRLGHLHWGGMFFSVKVQLGARGVQEWALPLDRKADAFRVGDFAVHLVGLSGSQREILQSWTRQQTGMVFVLSSSYWRRKGVGAALAEAPQRLWAMASRCVSAGYLEAELREQAQQLTPGVAAEMVVRALFEMLLARVGIITPGAMDDTQQLSRTIGMAIWGEGSPEADIDVAARLLAPIAAGAIIGGGLLGGTLVVARAAGRVGGAVAERVRPADRKPAVPSGPLPDALASDTTPGHEVDPSTKGAAGTLKPRKGSLTGDDYRAVQGGRPRSAERGLSEEPVQRHPKGEGAVHLERLTRTVGVLRGRRLLVAAGTVLRHGLAYARAKLRVLAQWFEGTIYYFQGRYYLALDGLKEFLVKLGTSLDEWIKEGSHCSASLFIVTGVGLWLPPFRRHLLAKAIVRLLLDRLPTVITNKEAALLNQVPDAGWQRILHYASGGAKIDALKGIIAEELVYLTPEVRAAWKRAEDLHAAEGGAPDALRFIPNVSGEIPRLGGGTGVGALTDGIIAAVEWHPDGKSIKLIRIYTVIESKSRGNVSHLFERPGGGPGQLERDLDRIRQHPIRVDGQEVSPGNVVISPTATEWLIATPPGTGLTPIQLANIQAVIPNVRGFPWPVRDAVLRRVAAEVARIAQSGEVFNPTGKPPRHPGERPDIDMRSRPEPDHKE